MNWEIIERALLLAREESRKRMIDNGWEEFLVQTAIDFNLQTARAFKMIEKENDND